MQKVMWDLPHECLRQPNSEEQENKISPGASRVWFFSSVEVHQFYGHS